MKKTSSTKKKKTQRRAGGRKATRPASSGSSGVRLKSVRRELLRMRDDLGRAVRQTPAVETAGTGDPVDQASLSVERELLFELSDNERATLDQIEAALRKIEKGTYGVCESCRKPISKPRLKALPFARYCIACQNSSEKVKESAEQPAEFGAIEETAAHELNS